MIPTDSIKLNAAPNAAQHAASSVDSKRADGAVSQAADFADANSTAASSTCVDSACLASTAVDSPLVNSPAVESLPKLELEVYGPSSEATVLELWQQLELRLAGSPLCCSATWTQTWLECYREVVTPWFVVARTGETIRGICLFSEVRTKTMRLFSTRHLHLGTAGEPHGHSVCVEYNDILVEPAFRAPFLNHLGRLLTAEKKWDAVYLDGVVPETTELWPETSSAAGPARTSLPLTCHRRVRESRYFDLAQSRAEKQDILDSLGKSTRSNLKRRIKQVEPLELEWAESLDHAQHIFSELIELHQARWIAMGEPGAFASSRFLRFQQQLIARLHPRGQVVLARIRQPDRTVGCLYLLVDRNRLLDYVSGFISFEEFPSPGLISHYLCMKAACERGYDAYDFLVGEKRHKENLGKSASQLEWVVRERPRLPYRLRDWGRAGKRLLARIVQKRES